MNPKINNILNKLTEEEIKIFTMHLTKIIAERIKVMYERERKNNPLAI